MGLHAERAAEAVEAEAIAVTLAEDQGCVRKLVRRQTKLVHAYHPQGS